jgi:DHA2 family multidrug resistance protein
MRQALPAPDLRPAPTANMKGVAAALIGITLAAVMEAITGRALALGRIDIIGALHATPDEIAGIDIAYVAAKLTAFYPPLR